MWGLPYNLPSLYTILLDGSSGAAMPLCESVIGGDARLAAMLLRLRLRVNTGG